MSTEAMKLALEALNSFPHRHLTPLVSDARTALREALAQPQQEPVAAECNFVGTKEWGRCSIEHHNLVQSEPHKWPGYQTRLLYTSSQPAQQEPPAWWPAVENILKEYGLQAIDFVADFKAALAEQPAQQEPVRIYDYVWPQRDEHKEECVYACSYTPGHHLARGELLAVVHPSQLKNAYLQRDDETKLKENA
jgi:hypothetical protein